MPGFARRSEAALFGLALALSAGAGLADAPARVVSMNLCTDQLALMLAAPGQVVSVTRLAVDPLASVMVEAAEGIPLNNGRAEEIYAMDPDLVLASAYSDPFATGLLEGLGVPVLRLPAADSLDDVPEAVREMGAALGREAEAGALAARIEARLAALPVPGADAPVAAFFYPNGYSLGAGTLSHDILTHAGFRNLAEELGREGGGTLALEDLLMNRPDLIVTSTLYPGASRSEEIMAHPALAGIPRVASGPEWVCGTPAVLDALDAMIAARAALGG